LGAALDWKTSLQELTSELALGVPEYRVESCGPDHAKQFQAEVLVAEDQLGVGTGSSKKVAEQHAAEAAWLTLSGRPRE
ncbi:MAG TPA: putative dsRNA-binding protein, partial [Actinomycetota bacterium]|nr:putative dsRNA-binding protein [Actinomycetota bacterium]